MQKKDTFINPAGIESVLAENAEPDRRRAMDVLDRALEKNGLTPADTAVLLNSADPEVIERLFFAAGQVKREIYGRRLVLFAPLYIANYCANNCLYCGFRRLKSTDIGTYVLFQETYDPVIYARMHPDGPKSATTNDAVKRKNAWSRSMPAGVMFIFKT